MNEAFLRGLPGGMGPFIKREPGDGKKDMKPRIPSQVKINEEDLPPEEREKREKERRWVVDPSSKVNFDCDQPP